MQDDYFIRVKQALTWLKRNKSILQKDVADEMGLAESSFTRALNRIKEQHDDNFIISFHSAVSKYISLEYLLHGTGDMLIENGNPDKSKPIEPAAGIPDMSSVFNSALAAKDETIESLKREIASLNARIADKERIIADKDLFIAEQKARLIESREGIDHYPFPIGAAEADKRQSKRK